MTAKRAIITAIFMLFMLVLAALICCTNGHPPLGCEVEDKKTTLEPEYLLICHDNTVLTTTIDRYNEIYPGDLVYYDESCYCAY